MSIGGWFDVLPFGWGARESEVRTQELVADILEKSGDNMVRLVRTVDSLATMVGSLNDTVGHLSGRLKAVEDILVQRGLANRDPKERMQ